MSRPRSYKANYPLFLPQSSRRTNNDVVGIHKGGEERLDVKMEIKFNNWQQKTSLFRKEEDGQS